MDARERIIDILAETYGKGHEDGGWEPTVDFGETADLIISIVREALLSDEAVDEMVAHRLPVRPLTEPVKAEFRDDARGELEAALDTAFGAGPRQEAAVSASEGEAV